MFYWLVECFILQSLLNMLLHDELEGKYLCTEIIQLHCAVVLSVSRDPSPWRHLNEAKGAYTPYCGWIVSVSEHQSVCCVRVSLIPTSPLSAILVLAFSRHSDT